MSRTRTLEPRGLSEREQQIMDRSDGGVGAPEIAAELGVALHYVELVIRQFDFATVWSNSDKAANKTREACKRYEAALAATGRCYA